MRTPELVIYEDKPHLGAGAIVLGIAVFLLLAALYSWRQGDIVAAQGQLAAGLVILLVLWAVWPRSYRVLPEAITVSLGGLFRFRIPYENIEAVRVSRRVFFGISLGTSVSVRHVEILRKRGLPISITPRDGARFVSGFEVAWRDWQNASGNTAKT